MFAVEKKSAVLSVSAHDPLGMAGVAIDQRALASLNVHCASCITANTAQNQTDFFSLNPVDLTVFVSQLDALYQQDIFSVIKVGLISDLEQAKALVNHPIFTHKTIVLDPVLGASSDKSQYSETRLAALKYLMAYVQVLTPNVNEAQVLISLLDDTFIQTNNALLLAQMLNTRTGCAVVLKGGHGAHKAQDVYCDNERHFYLEHAEYSHDLNRGTGCAMASLIAGAIALGHSMADAVVIAKMQMDAGWQTPFSIDDHTGSLGFVKFNQSDASQFNNSQLPSVYMSDEQKNLKFLPCGSELGLYPIVDRASWLERLLPLGVKVIQLRVKDLSGDDLIKEIKQCVKLANQYDCQLYINDYWQLAIECGAYGAHLGQEDIDDADLSAIANAGLRLGLSSHCFYEVARAKTIKPSYIAFGPVYATQTKDMPWVPQGETGLPYWRAQLAGFPLVAIGGIHGDRFEKVKAKGVHSIAMISAITQVEHPEQVCADLIARWDS
ncbi:MAG: hydroxymethylpyrimidine kinase/phosphomethylpyrimidine kinase/thiamine-phosphate diphosphorylase [Oceanicoccus sp.]|jgi:hydroxymethylpyrimidine kinase/phosphomethylpyrimidine kinase/thiamine-phosphate diphosphorylase